MSHEINQENTLAVRDDLNYLYAKIDRLSSPGYPKHSEFVQICNDIFGFTISCSASPTGKHAGLIINNFDNISIEAMGDGTANLLGLIVNLCVAEEKMFLIEELENDIHPKALKYLLEFILEKSKSNQLIVCTHSNIVARVLGSHPEAKIFHLDMKIEKQLPVSTVKEVENKAEARMRVLEDLGYELSDFELWPYYLILEESSAERIIKDFLIPEFVPSLKDKLKTIACQGIMDVKPRLIDFMRLFVFIHTAEIYKNRAWVIVDGDGESIKVITEMKTKFNAWNPEHFRNFKEKDFEKYYPEEFQDKVTRIDTLNKKEKREAKKQLLNEVLEWIEKDKKRAKSEFENSGQEVISLLQEIEKEISLK